MTVTPEQLASFFKKKGFIYPSSEIYGGLAGFYDYGHTGTLLKKNFENLWKNYFLKLNDNFFEIETANIMHEKAFKASGHLDNFIDPVINCSKCDFSDRADHFIRQELEQNVEGFSPEQLTALIQKHNLQCPTCKSHLKPVTVMNMMFPVNLGIGGKHKAYLRPETAQSPYVNFKLQYELQRKKLPLGLALIGRAYRNEISPRNLTLRQREFTQAELQIFFNPQKINLFPLFEAVKDYKLQTLLVEDRPLHTVVERTAEQLVEGYHLPQFYVYHLVKIQQFYIDVLKIPPSKFRLYQLNDLEKAFYNKYHFDLEVELTEFGFTEMGGLHYRTDHDLRGHQEISKEKMEIFDEESNSKFIPHVLELSFGVDRHVYMLLDQSYDDDAQRGNVIMHFSPSLAPFFCAVFPLVRNKPELVALAEEIYADLNTHFSCFYDPTSSIGRRYARADEIGVPYCITVDFDSLENDTVTIRDRETTQQRLVKRSELASMLSTLYRSSARQR
ncbi:MAG: glycine--tRNA ligase [Nanoarchaeota archaeon]|nr:glycine--tRNA ligase [Nanoarchaeota archaeon]